MASHTVEFKAEVQQLLDLVIHSLYSKKEIFLRELVSNSSDAIDRAQYEGLTDAKIVEDAPEWGIHITIDADARKLLIEDNGIGMTADEMENHLGTIARSGTRAFLESMREQAGAGTTPELIGQFGVGFYAAFMVASEVCVESLRRGEGHSPALWKSAGDGTYRIEESKRATPGTLVTLHLREDCDEYLNGARIRGLVRQYSDYIAWPIRLSEVRDAKTEDHDAPLNSTKAIWRRPRQEIEAAEYNAFYAHLAHDSEEPLKTIHIAAEGQLEFRALMFIPRHPGMDLFTPNAQRGLHLYVRNVFIGSHFTDLLPEYLRFVVGVVDSSDLPLNVSRETLQDNAVIRRIRSNLVGRILSTLSEMKEQDGEAYESFFDAFGAVLKEGLHTDIEQRDKLLELLLFPSLRSPEGKRIGLRAYRDAMPSMQTAIYTLSADDLSTARESPHLEWLRNKGFDVLFLTDPVDAWIAPALGPYDGVPVRAIERGELGAEETATSSAERDQARSESTALLDLLKESLKERVADVRLSERLSDSPCCLVADANAMPEAVERMLRAMRQDVPKRKRILEINPSHALIRRMLHAVENGGDGLDRVRGDADTLVDMALLAEGSPVPSPAKLAQRLAALMAAETVNESAEPTVVT